jgi:hypothetical protein
MEVFRGVLKTKQVGAGHTAAVCCEDSLGRGVPGPGQAQWPSLDCWDTDPVAGAVGVGLVWG